ncbi:MAG: hypothetical protein NTY64_06390 [Deltaproteobacteria bacterium]|nr:hypothetical protein [Deltaproteobacteria bacterium]
MKALGPFLLCILIGAPSLFAQERGAEKGEYKGFIVNEGKQVVRIGSVKPGQTLQIDLVPNWMAERGGKVEWQLDDSDGKKLRVGSQKNPEAEPISIEWTSNSEPKPSGYTLHILGTAGSFPGEILGRYTAKVSFWDQNDGSSGTDAPETFEKALLLPVSDPGLHVFMENFISGTADIYDIYKIQLKPKHSCTVKATPLQWKKMGAAGNLRIEFLDKSFRKLREGTVAFAQTAPFTVRVFHPKVRSDGKPLLFYLLLKMEGETSLIYSIEVEVKEGR